ncbi:uncharacterized protein VNE69_08144 [Vairimorpha necatrix]|uniref:Uncharacterized protein n=1 Tax=Vairimorpha necatrix TaxID=6039 RepID=A0AAX4JEN5_9MICR
MNLINTTLLFLNSILATSNSENQDKKFIVKSTTPLFTADIILNKAKEYNWPRERLMTMLILQRLYNVTYNESYEFAANADIEKFKTKLAETSELFAKFTKQAIENNNWKIDNDAVSLKIQDIENHIRLYLENNEMYELIHNLQLGTESGNSDDQILISLNRLTLDEWKNLEIDLLTNKSGILPDLIYNKYGVKKHYDEIVVHKSLLFDNYSELLEFLPDCNMVNIFCHDWSKYLLDLSIGYTFKFFIANDKTSKLVESWNKLIKNDIKDFFITLFNVGWKIHFKSEDHHPEFYANPDTEYYLAGGILRVTSKKNMNASGLQESFIDMSARELFVAMSENRASIKNANYIVFKTFYIDRYNKEDAEKVINLTLKIMKKYGDADKYEEKRKEYQEYLDGREEQAIRK